MDWRASWIWAKSHSETPNCYVYARREFDAANGGALVHVSCSTHYKLFVNGRFVGRGPGPCRPEYQYYDSYDASHLVRPGRNVIAALCHNTGVETSWRPAAFGGLILQVEATGDGHILAATDTSWRVRPAIDFDSAAPLISAELGFREIYDSRLKPVGWNVVGFDDSDWEGPELIAPMAEEEWANLVPRPIPLLRERETLPARVVASDAVKYARSVLDASDQTAIVSPGESGFTVLDFEREVVGFPEIRIRDGGRAVVDLDYAHTVDSDGELVTAGQAVVQSDRVILHGGRQEWQGFGRRAFRYIRATFRDLESPVLVESVSASLVGHFVEAASEFECSDERLNEAWHGAVHELGLRMQDTFEQSPLEGPAQSVSVARALALANYYCFGDGALAAKTLTECARLTDQKGLLIAPSPVEDSLQWVLMLHDYYLHTGDRQLVEDFYPVLGHLVQAVNHAAEGPSALRYQALRNAAKLASAIGQIDDSVEWHSAAEAVSEQGEAHLEMMANIEPAYLLPAETLGIRPSTPESRTVVVQPHVRELQWARGRVRTKAGDVRVDWRSADDTFSIEIEAPQGYMAGLPVAAFRNPLVEEADLSPETPERRARKAYGWGNLIWRDGEERDPYLDWLASQEAEPPDHYVSRKRLAAAEEYLWVSEGVSTHVRYDIRESPD